MPPTFPNEVVISGIKYEITIDSERVPEEVRMNLGRSDLSDCFIWINTNYNPQTWASTLLHEILHLIYGDIGHGILLIFEDAHAQEEYFVGIFDTHLIAVMKDNPEVRKFIFG